MNNRQLKRQRRRHKGKKESAILLFTLSLLLLTPTTIKAEWQQVGNDWKYRIDGTDQYVTGSFIDSNGDVYKFDSQGIMLHNFQDSYRRYYGPDGRARNYLLINRTDFEEKANSLKQGKEIQFDTKDEATNWKIFWDYCICDFGQKKLHLSVKDGKYTLDPTAVNTNDSEIADKTVYQLAQNTKADTIEQTIYNATIAVADYLDYDITAVNAGSLSFNDVCITRRSVCLGYARLTSEILKINGVEAEIVCGQVDNGIGSSFHAWLRTDLNQWDKQAPGISTGKRWLYTDPTWYDSSRDSKYLNINYNEYLDRYMMKGV